MKNESIKAITKRKMNFKNINNKTLILRILMKWKMNV